MARRGSNQRQRGYKLTVRFNAMEAEALRRRAESAGVPMGALARSGALNTPLPRAARRPTVSHTAIGRLLGSIAGLKGEYKRIGANINQLVRHVHAGHPQWNAIQLALQEFTDVSGRTFPELRTACLEALGRERPRPRPDKPDGGTDGD